MYGWKRSYRWGTGCLKKCACRTEDHWNDESVFFFSTLNNCETLSSTAGHTRSWLVYCFLFAPTVCISKEYHRWNQTGWWKLKIGRRLSRLIISQIPLQDPRLGHKTFVFTQQSFLVKLALDTLVLFAFANSVSFHFFFPHLLTSCFPGDLPIYAILASFTAAHLTHSPAFYIRHLCLILKAPCCRSWRFQIMFPACLSLCTSTIFVA